MAFITSIPNFKENIFSSIQWFSFMSHRYQPIPYCCGLKSMYDSCQGFVICHLIVKKIQKLLHFFKLYRKIQRRSIIGSALFIGRVLHFPISHTNKYFVIFFRWRGTQYKPAAYTIDGLRNVHYRLVQKKVYKFYLHFIIDINAPKRLHTPDMPSNPFSVKYLDEYKMSMEKYWDKIPLFHEQLQQWLYVLHFVRKANVTTYSIKSSSTSHFIQVQKAMRNT